MLALVAPARVVCAPWRLRGGLSVCATDDSHPAGAECIDCGADVAVPRSLLNAAPVCLYCGMDSGMVDLAEVEPT